MSAQTVRLLTVEQAAERLSVSRAKTYQLIKSGELESVKIDRSRRVPDDGIAKFVDSRRGGEAA